MFYFKIYIIIFGRFLRAVIDNLQRIILRYLKRHSQDLYLFSISFLLKAVSERIEISSSRTFFGYNLRNFTCVT